MAIIYLAAISLGLPDSLLGSVWPTIQQELGAPLSGATIAVTVFLSLPLWIKQTQTDVSSEQSSKPLTLKGTVRLRGAKEIFIAFFCYGAIEQTAVLWASSYMVLHCGTDTVTAAKYASMFYIGITAGRLFSGFLTIRFSDKQMIRFGMILVGCGVFALFLPFSVGVTLAGLILIGLGCAPIFPCIIHSTPDIFGADKSQAMIGVQMAACYLGIFTMPPLFGFITNSIDVSHVPTLRGA